ncbi:MAG: hypothetical protein ACLTXM_21655, partial [Enterococcus sp.]
MKPYSIAMLRNEPNDDFTFGSLRSVFIVREQNTNQSSVDWFVLFHLCFDFFNECFQFIQTLLKYFHRIFNIIC